MDLVGTLTKLATKSGLEREVRMRHGLRTVGAGLVAACAILLLGQRTAQGLADSSRSAAPVLGVATLGAAALNDDTPSAVPVSPARLLDTRPGQPTIDGVGYQGLMAAGQSTIVPVAGRAGVPNTGIDAVVVNITAITPSGGRTWLTVWPTGSPQPLASSLNPVGSTPTVNLVTSKVGVDGTITIRNAGAPTHVIVDVAAWHPVGAALTSLQPARLVDTRAGEPTTDGLGPQGRLSPGATVSIPILGRGGVPATEVGAVVLNLTALNASAATYLTVWPTGEARPTASNSNPGSSAALAKMVVSPLGADGAVQIYNRDGQVDVIVDVVGWSTLGGDLQPLAPSRLLDTRAGQPTVDGTGYRGTTGNGGSIPVVVAGRAGIPATGVGAVYLNITSDQTTTASFVTAYQSGAPKPYTSNLNPVGNQPTSNMVLMPVGQDGSVALSNAYGMTHLIVDVVGWYPMGTLIRGDIDGAGGQVPGLLIDQKARFTLNRPVGSAFSLVSMPNPIGGGGLRCSFEMRVHRPDRSLADESTSRGCDSLAGVEADLVINQAGGWPVEFVNRAWPRIDAGYSASLRIEATIGVGGLAVGGDEVVIPALAAGQNARWTFTPNVGEEVGISIRAGFAGGSALCDVRLIVRLPSGAIAATAVLPPCAAGSLPQLAVSVTTMVAGSWSAEVDNGPAGNRDAFGAVRAVRGVEAGQINIPAAVPIPDRPPGQPIRWSFNVATGMDLSLLVKLDDGSPFLVGACTDATIRRGDGSVFTTRRICDDDSRIADIDLVPDASGTWSLAISGPAPDGMRLGAFWLAATRLGGIGANPPSLDLSELLPGQNARQAIVAAVGDRLAVAWELGNLYSYCHRRIELRRPDGSVAAVNVAKDSYECVTSRFEIVADVPGTWTALFDGEASDLRGQVATFGVSREQHLGTVGVDTTVLLPTTALGGAYRFQAVLSAGEYYRIASEYPDADCRGRVQLLRPDGSAMGEHCGLRPVDFLADSSGTWTVVLVPERGVAARQLSLLRAFDGGVVVPGVALTVPDLEIWRPVRWRVPTQAGRPWTVIATQPSEAIVLDPAGETVFVYGYPRSIYEIEPTSTGEWSIIVARRPQSLVIYPDEVRIIPAGGATNVVVAGLRPFQRARVTRPAAIPPQPVPTHDNPAVQLWLRNADGARFAVDQGWWDGSIVELDNASEVPVGATTVHLNG